MPSLCSPHNGCFSGCGLTRYRLSAAWIAVLMLFLASSVLSGCSSSVIVESNVRGTTIDVFYATDRNFVGDAEHPPLYGNERDTLRYGLLQIERLPDHAIGSMEDETLVDGKRHDFVMLPGSPRHLTQEEFFEQLFRGVEDGERRDILLYVHGYNTTFDKAALTLAQVVSDLDFRGDAVLFSWPSAGKLLGYVRDQNNTDWSRVHLKAFLKELVSWAGHKRLCLLAHSMGNRELLTSLLELKKERPEIAEKIRVMIFAAPDVDSEVFCRDMAPLLADDNTLVTIYVARKKDKALNASKKLNGYVRLGGVDGEPVVMPGIDTVDVTNIDTAPFGHCYFARSRSVLADMYAIINGGLRAESRFSLSPVEYEKMGEKKIYWIFEK